MNRMISKFKTLPTWLQSILKNLAQFIGFIILWIVIASGLNLVIKPSKEPPNELFQVCVMNNNRPQLSHLHERLDQPLCQQEYENIELPVYHFMTLKKVSHKNDTQEWMVTEHSDSFNDPFIYSYQVKNNKVTPLWWSSTGWANTLLCYFFALFIAPIYWIIGKMVVRRINKNNQKINSKAATKADDPKYKR